MPRNSNAGKCLISSNKAMNRAMAGSFEGSDRLDHLRKKTGLLEPQARRMFQITAHSADF